MVHWIAAVLLVAFPTLGEAMPQAAPEGARVYIVTPTEGAVVENPVTIVFGLAGMGIAPAGVEHDNTGHHHLLIDVDPAGLDMTAALPADERHVHFGGGQTQVTLELPSGTHVLRLLLGDENHVPHDPPVISEPVTIVVE